MNHGTKTKKVFIPYKFPIIGHPLGPGGNLYLGFFADSFLYRKNIDIIAVTKPSFIWLSLNAVFASMVT